MSLLSSKALLHSSILHLVRILTCLVSLKKSIEWKEPGASGESSRVTDLVS